MHNESDWLEFYMIVFYAISFLGIVSICNEVIYSFCSSIYILLLIFECWISFLMLCMLVFLLNNSYLGKLITNTDMGNIVYKKVDKT